jgi:hypothetical protein
MSNLNNTSISRIYIGYEEREHDAYRVCKHSIELLSILKPVQLKSQKIPEYNRNWGEPQSTDFTFTRFWVPYLSSFTGYSIFVDCDFLFKSNPMNLAQYINPDLAVSVVQHPSYNPNTEIKMDGVAQHRSHRKNWASLMVFNNEHPSNKILTPEYLNNHKPGLDFHHFKWLKDEEIGSIPLEWNCMDGYYHLENPKAIHYTDGGPWFGDKYQDTMYAKEWKTMWAYIKQFKDE